MIFSVKISPVVCIVCPGVLPETSGMPLGSKVKVTLQRSSFINAFQERHKEVSQKVALIFEQTYKRISEMFIMLLLTFNLTTLSSLSSMLLLLLPSSSIEGKTILSSSTRCLNLSSSPASQGLL